MKKILAVLVIFTLSVNQVGLSCWGKDLNLVNTDQPKSTEIMKKENNQQELNENILARLADLEAKIDTKKDKKVDLVVNNIFLRTLYVIKKAIFFIIKKFFWLCAVLGTYTGFAYLFVEKQLKSIDKVDKVANSVLNLLMFLDEHRELAEGIYSQLFSVITGNNGNHELTSEEKQKLINFIKKMEAIFYPDQVEKLKNFKKEDAVAIYMLASGLENELNGR